jgi:hypothetical protein
MYLQFSVFILRHVSRNILCLTVGIAFLMLMFQILTVNPLLNFKKTSRTLSNEIILVKNLFPYKKIIFKKLLPQSGTLNSEIILKTLSLHIFARLQTLFNKRTYFFLALYNIFKYKIF